VRLSSLGADLWDSRLLWAYRPVAFHAKRSSRQRPLLPRHRKRTLPYFASRFMGSWASCPCDRPLLLLLQQQIDFHCQRRRCPLPRYGVAIIRFVQYDKLFSLSESLHDPPRCSIPELRSPTQPRLCPRPPLRPSLSPRPS
jgi:hypothetical protein